MSAIDNLLKFIERNEAKFISLKYYDKDIGLKQVDVAAKSLVIIDDFISVNNLKLQPIDNRYFVDPFRSYRTIFCLCDNITNESNSRILLKNIILARDDFQTINFELAVNFLISDRQEKPKNSEDHDRDYQNQVEPLDQLANLRAEIIEILETIPISTICHFHANKKSSCSIVIKAENFIDLADYLVITNYVITNVAESYGKLAYFTNELNNSLLLLFPESKYNKELAISIISSIMTGLGNNEINIFVNNLTKQNITENYYSYNITKNCHTVSLSLNHNYNIYLVASYLLIYGFDIELINGKQAKEILCWYFDKNNK